MGGMPDFIARPNFLRELDQVAAGFNAITNVQQRLDVCNAAIKELQDLQGVSDFVTSALNNGLIKPTTGGKSHIDGDWLGENWWQYTKISKKTRKAVLQQAFIKAVELVRDTYLPLHSYWICSGPPDGTLFAAAVGEGPGAVVLVLHTPFPLPPTGKPAKGYDKHLWVVLENAKGDVETRNAEYYPLLGA